MNITVLDQVSGANLDAATYSTQQNMATGRAPQVGDSYRMSDGSEYVLASTAVDCAAGDVMAIGTCQATIIANLCTAAAAGSYTVEVDTTGVAMFGGSAGVIAANRLAGGSLVIGQSSGLGYRYVIKSNTAGTASAKVTLTLTQPLKVAVSATTDVFLVGSPYDNVVAGTAALQVAGIACVPSTAATNSRTEYIWLQVAGVAGVKITTGTSIAVGKALAADASAGVKVAGAVTDILVGNALATSTTAGDILPVWLTFRK